VDALLDQISSVWHAVWPCNLFRACAGQYTAKTAAKAAANIMARPLCDVISRTTPRRVVTMLPCLLCVLLAQGAPNTGSLAETRAPDHANGRIYTVLEASASSSALTTHWALALGSRQRMACKQRGWPNSALGGRDGPWG
jgi:hypothetical protein